MDGPLDESSLLFGIQSRDGIEMPFADPAGFVFPGKLLVRDVDIAATLDNGYLVVEKARIDGAHGDVTIEGALNAGADPAVTAWAVQTEAFRFGLLAGGVGLEALPANAIRFQVEASGNTLRELAGTANGSIRVVGGSGVTTNTGLDRTLNAFSYAP